MWSAGTLVSGTLPIAVFSGNTHVSIQADTDTGHVVEQMPPLHTYGTEFAIMPNPIRYVASFALPEVVAFVLLSEVVASLVDTGSGC